VRLSVDTGGTFTDLVVEDVNGAISVFKRPTTPDDPPHGILDVLAAAATARGLPLHDFLATAHTLIHATTHALNALLTQGAARTALLTTRGHEDVLVLREGGREHFNVRAPFPDPLVPRALTFGIEERVTAAGDVLVPLHEDQAVALLRELPTLDVDAIAVMFLWSIVNPSHEERVGELIEQELPGVPFTLSHRLSAGLREFRRASAAAIDASLKPLMDRYLQSLSRRLEEAGFRGRLLMVTSSGALLDVREVASAPIHAIKSGPAMAPVAGRLFAKDEGADSNVIVTDTGGTSYDVSAVRDGVIPWTRETWLGAPYLSPMTGFPSVDVKSYGAGGGSIAWVDAGGLLHVGPQSAGADPGPACYGRGGANPTFTDAAVALGLIDPGNFLGGLIHLDADASGAALRRAVGEPLGLDGVESAAAVLDVMSEQMARAIEDIALRQGVDPASACLVAGGGAAGLNAIRVARLVGCPTVVVPGVSAALSAAGALLSDIGKDFVVTFPTRTSSFDHEGVAQVLARLHSEAAAFLDDVADSGVETGMEHFAEAHYVREVWEIEVPVALPLASREDVERLREDFHRRHDEVYAVSDPDADLEIISWRLRAWCRPATARSNADRGRKDGTWQDAARLVWFAGHGWQHTPVRHFNRVAPGERLVGPTVVTSSVTTTIIDPGWSAVARADGSLVVTQARAGTATT
jgi:N-methylhydantoinase A